MEDMHEHKDRKEELKKDKKDEKDKKTLNEEYAKLKSEYNLPDFDIIDKDFEISDIEPEDNILREILKSIHGHAESYNRLLEGLIQPDSKLSDMKEASNIDQEEQTLIAELYRKGMLMNRSILLVDLDFDEKTAAAMIIHAHKEWQGMKLDMRKILEKMKSTWESSSAKEKYGGGYFG
jgi:hypothetical protein